MHFKRIDIITKIGRILLLIFFLLLVFLPIYWITITAFKTTPEIINAQELTYIPKILTTV
jgi:multiple sugar transport system permease protein